MTKKNTKQERVGDFALKAGCDGRRRKTAVKQGGESDLNRDNKIDCGPKELEKNYSSKWIRKKIVSHV